MSLSIAEFLPSRAAKKARRGHGLQRFPRNRRQWRLRRKPVGPENRLPRCARKKGGLGNSRQRLGLRQSLAALDFSAKDSRSPTISLMSLVSERKAPEDWRSPKASPVRRPKAGRSRASVLDCGSPLPLWISAPKIRDHPRSHSRAWCLNEKRQGTGAVQKL